MLDLILTLAGLVSMLVLGIVANWRAGLPWNDLKPRRVPWGLVMIFAGFGFVILLVHLVNLAGLETGPENSPFSRF